MALRCRQVLAGAMLLSALSAQHVTDGRAETVLSATGRLEGASDTAILGTGATGLVKQIMVKPGDRVKKASRWSKSIAD